MRSKDWVRERIRGVHVDFHTPEFPRDAVTRFDAKEFVAKLVKGRVNWAAVFAKDHFGNSFYDTKIGHKHSGLRCDFLGDVVEECHRNDIKACAYYSVNWERHAGDANPDWWEVDEKGEPKVGTSWGSVCINSPYREELAIPQLLEVARDYDIDGYFFDIIHFRGPCYCDYCKPRFKELFGKELAPGLIEAQPLLFREFEAVCYGRFLREMRQKVDRFKPYLVFVGNRSPGYLGPHFALSEYLDVDCVESQPASPERGGYLQHGLKSRYHRTQPRPFEVTTVRFTRGWGEMTLKETEQLKFEFAQIMANGGHVVCGDQVNPDGTLVDAVYERMGRAFRLVEECEPFCIGARAVRHIAILAPMIHGIEDSLLGCHKALVESHRQFDVIDSNMLEDARRYAIIVVPDNDQLSEKDAERLAWFVEEGGTIVATGAASLQRGRLLLGHVLGVEFLDRAPYTIGYVEPSNEIAGRLPAMPLLVCQRFYKVTPTTASPLARYIYPVTESCAPHRAFRTQAAPPGDDSGFPAATMNRFGKGTGIYIATPIFRALWQRNHLWLRQLASNVLDLVDTEPPFVVAAPSTVEANLMEKDGAVLLHLTNFHAGPNTHGDAGPYPMIEEIPRLFAVTVRIRCEGEPKRVTQEPGGHQLKYSLAGKYVQVTVPELHVHTIVRVE